MKIEAVDFFSLKIWRRHFRVKKGAKTFFSQIFSKNLPSQPVNFDRSLTINFVCISHTLNRYRYQILAKTKKGKNYRTSNRHEMPNNQLVENLFPHIALSNRNGTGIKINWQGWYFNQVSSQTMMQP